MMNSSSRSLIVELLDLWPPIAIELGLIDNQTVLVWWWVDEWGFGESSLGECYVTSVTNDRRRRYVTCF